MFTKKTTSDKSFAQKMSLMAGSMAVLAFPEAANAAIVNVTGSPVTVFTITNGAVDWDIDNDGTPETSLAGFPTQPFLDLRTWNNGSIVGLSNWTNLFSGGKLT